MRQLRTAPAAAWLRWQTRTWPWLRLHTRKLEWLAGGCWLGSKCSFEHGCCSVASFQELEIFWITTYQVTT